MLRIRLPLAHERLLQPFFGPGKLLHVCLQARAVVCHARQLVLRQLHLVCTCRSQIFKVPLPLLLLAVLLAQGRQMRLAMLALFLQLPQMGKLLLLAGHQDFDFLPGGFLRCQQTLHLLVLRRMLGGDCLHGIHPLLVEGGGLCHGGFYLRQPFFISMQRFHACRMLAHLARGGLAPGLQLGLRSCGLRLRAGLCCGVLAQASLRGGGCFFQPRFLCSQPRQFFPPRRPLRVEILRLRGARRRVMPAGVPGFAWGLQQRCAGPVMRRSALRGAIAMAVQAWRLRFFQIQDGGERPEGQGVAVLNAAAAAHTLPVHKGARARV